VPHVQESLAGSIELPLLSCSILDPSSEVHISVSVHFHNSSEWKSGSDVEWSVDMESEFFTESFLWSWFGFIKIDDLPSLVRSTMLLPSNDLPCFFILSTMNIKYFLLDVVDEELIRVSEDLPPIGVSAPDLHVVGLARVLDIP